MDFDSLLLEILDEFIDGKKVDIEEYCKRHPEHRDAILSKFKTAEFLKNNFHEEELNGKQLGEYIILQELGRGGMGIVFLGIQPALSRLSAIKVLSPSFSHDREALQNFQEEAKTIAKFSHPNIVPIYSISDEKGMRYIAMGYISGRSLKDIIEALRTNKQPDKLKATAVRDILQEPLAKDHDISQKNITVKRDTKFWEKSYFQFVATIGAEIADALSYAHQNGIVHGDLKPSNILLTTEAIPMVADFGLSRNIKEIASSKNNEFAGTLIYAAPEQIKENVLNEKTDIWSLGVTLYELLTFKNPFVDRTVKKTAHKILKANPAPLRTSNKKIPAELEAIVLKCLELNPKNRYESLSELSRDLKNYLESRPIKARPIGAIGRVGKWIRRQPVLAGLAGLFIFSIIFFSFLLYVKTINDLANAGLASQRGLKFKAAENAYKRVLALSISDPFTKKAREQALTGLGGIYSIPDPDKSLRYYKKALAINPKNIRTQLNIAHAYLDLDNYDEASKRYNSILQANPDDPEVIYGYVTFMRKSHALNLALEFLAEKSKIDDIKDHLYWALREVLKDLIEESRQTSSPIDSYEKIKEILISSGFDEQYIESFFEHDWKLGQPPDMQEWFEKVYKD